MSSILSFLNSDNYRVYNVLLARKLGSVNAAIMLSEIVQRYEYHKNKNELEVLKNHEGDWFYYTIDLCEERTGLTRDQQDPAINILIKMGLIKKIISGVPPKRFFQIDEKKILENLLDSKNVSNLRKIHKLNCGKSTNQNEENPQNNKENRERTFSARTERTENREGVDEPCEVSDLADVPVSSLPSPKGEKLAQGQGLRKRDKRDWALRLAKEEREFHEVVIAWVAPNGESLESEFITAQLKLHGLEKCQQAFDFCLYTIEKTGIKKTFGGMFRNAVKHGYQAPDENFKENKRLAAIAKKASSEFVITQKYISLPKMSWDLPYSMPTEEFKKEVLKKMKYLKGIVE
jgi:hypothetical protein